MKKMLVVRTSSMGDLVHTWPALTECLGHCPNLHITWLVEEDFVALARLHPAVDEVIPVAWRRWRKYLFNHATWQEMDRLHLQLKNGTWDIIIDSQGLIKSAFLAFLARGKTVGYSWQNAREPLASLFYKENYSVDHGLCAVEKNRALFAKAFCYSVFGEPKFGLELKKYNIENDKDPYIVFLHTTSQKFKQWPIEYWIDLGKKLTSSKKIDILIPWSNQEEYLRAIALSQAIPYSHLLKKLDLKEMIDIIKNAFSVFGLDTGLTHLANAFNIPLVAIYTQTDPKKTGVVETPYAINIGGVGKIPEVDAVFSALNSRCGLL